METKPNTTNSVFRVMHLYGGCRAVDTEDGRIEFFHNTSSGRKAVVKQKSYHSTYKDLLSIRTPVIGAEFYTHNAEIKGHYPPQWRTIFYSGNKIWMSKSVQQKWSQVGHAAFKNKLGELWDISNRISYQCDVCFFRIHQISQAYFEALNASIIRKSHKNLQRYEDEFSWRIYLAIQSFLIDACILRDYFAEFTAKYSFNEIDVLKRNKITSISALKSNILDKFNIENDLFIGLKEATDTNGWIKKLGDYRNLIVHSAPLTHARKKLFTVCSSLQIKDGEELPTITCPIPEDPHLIKKWRHTEQHFDSFAKQFDMFTENPDTSPPPLDGLEYCHDCMRLMAILANRLIQEAPVPPEMPLLDKTNVIGPVTITTII